MEDVIREGGYAFLGSRLRRLAERLQGDMVRHLEDMDLALQPAQCTVLAAIDREGRATVGDLVRTLGISQPGVTRALGKMESQGWVETLRPREDRRHRHIALTGKGRAMLARLRQEAWPRGGAAVAGLCSGLDGPLLGQLDALESRLADRSLYDRISHGPMAGLAIRDFADSIAHLFYDINAEWVRAMFEMEPIDEDILSQPRKRIVDPGGAVLFVEHPDLGIIGTGALMKTGETSYELTKMGVLETARGKKAGEFLLVALIARARELGAQKLYLMTNSICRPAIHLYEKLGFEHDADIKAQQQGVYKRSDVFMRYRGPLPGTG